MANKVQLFRSDDVGAPQLTNAIGSLIGVFDACLVNGYGTRDSTKISSVTSVSDVATITFNMAHGFRELQRLEVVLPDEQYTGVFDVTSVTANSLTIKLNGIPTSATCTPDASSLVKVAGAKWVKEFAEANKAAYRPALNTANRCYLSVDDSLTAINNGIANVRGFEAMTGATTGERAFPTTVQQAVCTIPKSSDANPKNWILVADGDMFYFFVNPSVTSTNNYFGFAFGYPKSKMTLEDTFGCILIASSGTNSTIWTGFRTTTTGGWYARSFTQIGGSVQFSLFGSGITTGLGNGGDIFPSPIDNSLNVSPLYIFQGGTRGILQGILQPLHNRPLGHGSYYKGLAEFPNQTILSIGLADSPNTAITGELHIIVEGLW
jgi:hypothetical protein